MQTSTEYYDNGLPYKPFLVPMSHELLWVEKEQVNGLCIYLSDETLGKISNFQLQGLDLKEDELWADFGDYYIVTPQLSEKTIECINGSELLISFFDEDVTTLLGLRIN